MNFEGIVANWVRRILHLRERSFLKETTNIRAAICQGKWFQDFNFSTKKQLSLSDNKRIHEECNSQVYGHSSS